MSNDASTLAWLVCLLCKIWTTALLPKKNIRGCRGEFGVQKKAVNWCLQVTIVLSSKLWMWCDVRHELGNKRSWTQREDSGSLLPYWGFESYGVTSHYFVCDQSNVQSKESGMKKWFMTHILFIEGRRLLKAVMSGMDFFTIYTPYFIFCIVCPCSWCRTTSLFHRYYTLHCFVFRTVADGFLCLYSIPVGKW